MDAANIVRGFQRHKPTGDVYLVARVANSSQIEKAVKVDARFACRHMDKNLPLVPVGEFERDGDVDLNEIGVMENYELDCTNADHLLADIGKQETVCQHAEARWKSSKAETSSLKETFDEETEKLRALIRMATGPSNTPLLDTDISAYTKSQADECHICLGAGEVEVSREVSASEATGGMSEATGTVKCEHCAGSGREPDDVIDGEVEQDREGSIKCGACQQYTPAPAGECMHCDAPFAATDPDLAYDRAVADAERDSV